MSGYPKRILTRINPFLALAEQQLSAPVKARMHAAEKRAAGKELKERDAQAKAWRAWRRERREALLAGPHGAGAKALLDILQRMTLADADALVEAVDRGPWRQTDSDTRFEVLSLIDDVIITLREQHGLDPFDDALPFTDEAPTAFLRVREALA